MHIHCFTADYQSRPSPRFFDFQQGNPIRMCTTFTIEMDDILEEVENFFADLDVPQTERVMLDPEQTQIDIIDFSGECCFFWKGTI